MLVYMAILTPVLLLFCGLVVDVGAIEFKRLQMQSACDAAALGAELELERGTGKWVAAAQGDAGVNGFTNGSNNVTVAAAMAPTSGAYSGFYDAVQTTISQPMTTAFSAILGRTAPTVNVRSVAIIPPCVYLMGVKNLSQYELSTTGATINSVLLNTTPAACPYYINGQASVDLNTGFSAMAENVTSGASGNTWSDTPSVPPRFGAAVLTDPLAAVTQPTAGTCIATNYTLTYTGSGSGTAGPGTYCGTTTIKCDSTNNVLTMSAGLYVIEGTLKVTSCTLNGTGVTFFFTKYNGSYGQLITSGTAMNLTAPTSASSGSIPGVVFMTDRNWQATSAQDFQLTSTNIKQDGIWYLTGAGLSIVNGTLVATNYTGVVADNLVVQNSTLTTGNNYSNLTGGNPFRPAGGLVE